MIAKLDLLLDLNAEYRLFSSCEAGVVSCGIRSPREILFPSLLERDVARRVPCYDLVTTLRYFETDASSRGRVGGDLEPSFRCNKQQSWGSDIEKRPRKQTGSDTGRTQANPPSMPTAASQRTSLSSP